MIELQISEYYKATPLFTGIEHSHAIVYAVLEGHSPGRLWVDNPLQPACSLMLPEGAFYYAAGNPDNQVFLHQLDTLIFDELLPGAAEPEMVLFSFSPVWHQRLAQVLEHRGVITIHRKMFLFNPVKFHRLKDWRSQIPAGFTIHPIDQSLATSYPVYRSLLEIDSKRFGFCLLENETVVCSCYAIFVGHGEAEIDIRTEEQYRGRGFAQLTACAFIEECLSRGLTPNWSCWPEREASWRLALNLGFDELPDVPAILWAEDL